MTSAHEDDDLPTPSVPRLLKFALRRSAVRTISFSGRSLHVFRRPLHNGSDVFFHWIEDVVVEDDRSQPPSLRSIQLNLGDVYLRKYHTCSDEASEQARAKECVWLWVWSQNGWELAGPAYCHPTKREYVLVLLSNIEPAWLLKDHFKPEGRLLDG